MCATSKIGEFTRVEMVAYCRSLEFRWLRLAEQAQETGGGPGSRERSSGCIVPAARKTATYRVEYGKRAGELIARGALVARDFKTKEANPPVIGAAY